MGMLLEGLCLILCKKVPNDLEIKSILKLHEKVKFYPKPQQEEPEKKVGCVLRLQIPVDKHGEEVE